MISFEGDRSREGSRLLTSEAQAGVDSKDQLLRIEVSGAFCLNQGVIEVVLNIFQVVAVIMVT